MITAEQIKFPADFEKLAKTPPAANGASYPYRISAKDLMADFNAAALLVDTTETNGLKLVETREGGKRYVSIEGAATSGGSSPDGSAGDYLYHDGSGWVARAVTELTISVCVDGTPTPITFLTVTA